MKVYCYKSYKKIFIEGNWYPVSNNYNYLLKRINGYDIYDSYNNITITFTYSFIEHFYTKQEHREKQLDKILTI